MRANYVLVSLGLVLGLAGYACSGDETGQSSCTDSKKGCGGAAGETNGQGGSTPSDGGDGVMELAGATFGGSVSGASGQPDGANQAGAAGAAPWVDGTGGADAGGGGGGGESEVGRTTPPGCPVETYGDGDVWTKSYDFQLYLVPLAVGPNGRLHAGFYRGYSFSDDDGKTWTTKDLSGLISRQQSWPQPAVSADGNSVWLYVAHQGTLHSKDRGRAFEWVPALSGMSAFDRGWVVVSPYHTQHILAFAVREDAPGSLAGTLYRSVDGGAHWANLDAAIAAAGGNGALSAAFDPANTDRFWIADMPEGVLETSNGGTSFAAVPGSTHDYISGVTRTFDGKDPRLVVTGACSAPRSSVIGQNVWQSSKGDSPSCCPWPALLADPLNPAVAVAYQCHDAAPDNLRYSLDGGVNLSLATWPPALDTASQHIQSVHVDPYHRRTFYAVHGHDWTLLKSTDGGATWAAVGWLPGHGC